MPERAFSTATWGDDWFMPLSRDQRYLSMYLELNQHCNPAGVYHLRLEVIAFEAKFGLEELPELLTSLPNIRWCPEYNIVWVKDFLRRQAKSPKFLTAAARCLADIRDHGLVEEVMQYNLDQYGISIPYRYPTDKVLVAEAGVSIPPPRVSIPPDTDARSRSKAKGEDRVVKGKEPGRRVPIAETATGSSASETHEGSKGATETAEESELLGFLETLEGWRSSSDDIAWLREFRPEWPDFALALAKACRDYHSGRVQPKHKGVWKNRFREWMKHEKQYAERGAVGSPGSTAHQRAPTQRRDYKGSIDRFHQQHG